MRQFWAVFGDFSAAFGECQFVIGIWDRLRGREFWVLLVELLDGFTRTVVGGILYKGIFNSFMGTLWKQWVV